jgi:hypothetical protein
MQSIIKDPTDALNYIYGGKGKFTIVSKKTDTRFTYRVSRGKKRENSLLEPLMFVSVLNGPDNQSNYKYIGYIDQEHIGLQAGRKGQPTLDSYIALNWVINQVAVQEMPPQLEVWHSGKCGACGRELTVPESIATGLGPVCAKRVYDAY